jgi:hypothetical protein
VLVLPWAHNPFLALRNTTMTDSTISMIAHYNLATGQKAQHTILQKIDLAPGASTVIALKEPLGLLPGGAQDVGMEVTTSDGQGHPVSGATVSRHGSPGR